MMHRMLAGLVLLLDQTALSQKSQFDPTSYIQAMDVQPKLQQGEVSIKGIKYRVFTSGHGQLYVPALDNLTKSDLERSLCVNDIPKLLEKCDPRDTPCIQRNRERMLTEVTVVRAETALTESTKAYAEVIGTTIKKRCGDVTPDYFVLLSVKPEFGIEYKDTHQRNATAYKVYTPGWKPEVGFKMDF